MFFLDKRLLWDDMMAGVQHDRGCEKIRKSSATMPVQIVKDGAEGAGEHTKNQRMVSTPVSPGTLVMPASPGSACKDNMRRSVFHPESNLAAKTIGSHYIDKPQPNSPTVHDWLYSDETWSKNQ